MQLKVECERKQQTLDQVSKQKKGIRSFGSRSLLIRIRSQMEET